MAGQYGIRVEGANRLRSTLKRAGHDLDDLTDSHKQAAELVTNASRPASPRRTGQLASTIRASGTPTQAVIRAGNARVRQAGPLHFGWAARNIRPRPWITDAAQRTEPQWTQIYEHGVETVLRRIRGE